MNLHKQNNFRRWWDSISIMDRIIADGFAYLVWITIFFLTYFFITDAFYFGLMANAWWLILVAWLIVFFMEIDADPYKYAWTFKEREEWKHRGM